MQTSSKSYVVVVEVMEPKQTTLKPKQTILKPKQKNSRCEGIVIQAHQMGGGAGKRGGANGVGRAWGGV